jgi:3-deoxy-7-phosphoheptulonate synthase
LRGGAYKPRSNPHSFQGLGLEALQILAEVRERTGLGVVTEVMDPRLVEEMSAYVDVFQIGSRSMQNFPLLKEVGRTTTPVLLKRGWSSTLEEWLGAAEYIALEGNREIMLCERGIRASCHDGYARHILDLNVIEAVRDAVPFPVIVDPSHAAGIGPRVAALGRAALVAGAHGLLIEVVLSEEQRSELKCDPKQGILPDTLADIAAFAQRMETVVSAGA